MPLAFPRLCAPKVFRKHVVIRGIAPPKPKPNINALKRNILGSLKKLFQRFQLLEGTSLSLKDMQLS